MSLRVLVTRPQPGADRTAARLQEAGFEPIVLPLSEIVAVAPALPASLPGAVAISSANAVRLLTEWGIDGLQGHYFSPPLPFDGFAAWLDQWSRDHAADTPLAGDGRA